MVFIAAAVSTSGSNHGVNQCVEALVNPSKGRDGSEKKKRKNPDKPSRTYLTLTAVTIMLGEQRVLMEVVGVSLTFVLSRLPFSCTVLILCYIELDFYRLLLGNRDELTIGHSLLLLYPTRINLTAASSLLDSQRQWGCLMMIGG